MVVFVTLNIWSKLRISVISSSQWNMFSVKTFWVIWRKVMHTCEAPNYWGLHKNMNCAFPLRSVELEGDEINSIVTLNLYNKKYRIIAMAHICHVFLSFFKDSLYSKFLMCALMQSFVHTKSISNMQLQSSKEFFICWVSSERLHI